MNDLGDGYKDLSAETLLYLNVFGEPFFDVSGCVIKISPESGEEEQVCSSEEFNAQALDDYWTGDSLKTQWEATHGQLKEQHWLVPITPFVLGGAFDASNLMELTPQEAIAFYKDIRDQIKAMPDGSRIELVVLNE